MLDKFNIKLFQVSSGSDRLVQVTSFYYRLEQFISI
jgi:hypothetical protein